jgi:hypothetical protein
MGGSQLRPLLVVSGSGRVRTLGGGTDSKEALLPLCHGFCTFVSCPPVSVNVRGNNDLLLIIQYGRGDGCPSRVTLRGVRLPAAPQWLFRERPIWHETVTIF